MEIGGGLECTKHFRLECSDWLALLLSASIILKCFHCTIFTEPLRFQSNILEVYFFTYISGPPVSKQPVLTHSDSEEEIDFGFWEKAPVPSNALYCQLMIMLELKMDSIKI